MKIMYLARFSRFDLLRAVCKLAKMITKWTRACDLKLLRLVKYILHSRTHRQIGFIGDLLPDLRIGFYTDSDFAGDKKTQKSTSGMFLCLYGPNSFFPLAGGAKQQGAMSTCSTEAELVAASDALKKTGLPMLSLLEPILQREHMALDMFQDNHATARIMTTGKAPTLRHIRRTHGVSLAFVHEVVTGEDVQLCDCSTKAMAADIFTKHFINPDAWRAAIMLIGVVSKEFMKHFQMTLDASY